MKVSNVSKCQNVGEYGAAVPCSCKNPTWWSIAFVKLVGFKEISACLWEASKGGMKVDWDHPTYHHP